MSNEKFRQGAEASGVGKRASSENASKDKLQDLHLGYLSANPGSSRVQGLISALTARNARLDGLTKEELDYGLMVVKEALNNPETKVDAQSAFSYFANLVNGNEKEGISNPLPLCRDERS